MQRPAAQGLEQDTRQGVQEQQVRALLNTGRASSV